MDKEEARKNRNVQLITALVSISITLVSVFGISYFKEPEPEKAEVQQIDGVYVFIKSMPLIEYQSLGQVNLSSIDRAISSIKGEKKFGKLIKNIGKSLIGDASFENRLQSIIIEAKNKNFDVEGLIFSGDLTECEAIKFK